MTRLLPNADGSERSSTRITIETIAVGTNPTSSNDSLFRAYGRFRARRYNEVFDVDIDADGTDFDRFDPHAVHLAAIVRTTTPNPSVKIVGAMRVIVATPKSDTDLYQKAGLEPDLTSLPIELQYPISNQAIDLRQPARRCEISRYLADRADVSLALRRVTTQHFLNLRCSHAYAIVERRLEILLRRGGVSMRRVTSSRHLDLYGTENYGVEIDLKALAHEYGLSPSDAGPPTIGVTV